MADISLTEDKKGKWEAFVAATGKTADEVATALAGELGPINDAAVANLGDADVTPDADLMAALAAAGIPRAIARAAIKGIRNAPVPAPAAAATDVDPNKELGEDEKPTREVMSGFAGMTGMDPMFLMALMSGNIGDMDISGMIPVATLVQGYNPKIRNMFLMVMGQLEGQLGVPIIVIDGDGAINKTLTIEYIEGLQEGRDPAENNIYFDNDGTPHEVIRVGVDAQSVYDADPLDPTRALQKNGMGIGRINWSGVPLEVKQVAYYAANRTNEIDPKNDAHLSWLRDHVKKGANRLVFHGQAPRAIGEFNEARRTGTLPTLVTQLSRGPRRPETFPRRRPASPTDLSGIEGRNTRDGGHKIT